MVALSYLKKEVTFDGTSMLPSIKNGQKLTIRRMDEAVRASLARGDILVFKYPKDPSRFYIKRLIGMPGERIEIHAGQVLINGIKLSEPYVDSKLNLSHLSQTQAPVVVPARSYYVLGDNRDNSSDSRIWGFVPEELLPIWVLAQVEAFHLSLRLITKEFRSETWLSALSATMGILKDSRDLPTSVKTWRKALMTARQS
jgi:signal peptidase I